MRKRKAIIALLAAGVLPLTTAATCGSDGPSGPDHPAGGSTQIPAQKNTGNTDCGYSWNPCSGASAQPKSDGGSGSSANPPSGAVRWGDWKFGDCALSLYPAYVGLTMHPSGNLVILASTACVGFQPREITVHIALQRWWAPGGIKHDWHDTGTVLTDATLPPLVILPPDGGDPPLSEQHQISTGVHCTSDATQQNVPYRLRIDLLGVSYGGDPIVTGGYTSPLIITGWHCN